MCACRGFVLCAMLVIVVVSLPLRDVEFPFLCLLCAIAVLYLGPWCCMFCCWVFLLLSGCVCYCFLRCVLGCCLAYCWVLWALRLFCCCAGCMCLRCSVFVVRFAVLLCVCNSVVCFCSLLLVVLMCVSVLFACFFCCGMFVCFV